MNKAFEKILEFIDEQIKIEKSIAKSENEGHPITHQYGANCMNVIKKFVQEVAEEYKKENYFNIDHATLHKCPKCGCDTQHRVNQRGSWACGCFKCKLFKSDYDHQKAIQKWEDFCKEYSNGWIACSERLPDKAGYEVLATIENGYGQRRVTIIFTGYGDSQWHCNHKEFDLDVWKVIAWQPLPEPYQSKGE